MKKRLVSALLTATLSAALLAGCSGGNTSTETTKAPENSSTTNTTADTTEGAANTSTKTQLNAAFEICASQLITWDLNASWFTVRCGVGECLVKNGDDGSYQPWLAESWEVADDNVTWTFKLKSGIKFSNGTDMTATKVKEAIEYVYANDANGDIASFMTYESITADDAANTITIVTSKPQPDVPGVMAYPMMTIFDVEATTADGRDPVTQGVIATGPYAFASFTQDHDIQLVKNEYYYEEVPFETVNIQIVKESSNRLAALQDQSADMAINIASADRTILSADPSYTVSLVSGARTGVFFMNMESVLGNDDLRKAVLMAYDKETVCAISTQGSYTAGYSILSPAFDLGGDSFEDATPYDVEGAKAILDAAGIVDSNGDGFRELNGEEINIRVKHQTNRQMDVMASAIVENLKDIGIKAEAIPFTAQSDEMKAGDFELGSSNYMVLPTGDAASFLGNFASSGVDNRSRYSSEEYDAVYAELQNTMDAAKRKELVGKLQEILNKDAAVLVGGYYNFNICGAPTVTGVHNPTCDFYWITNDIKPAQ